MSPQSVLSDLNCILLTNLRNIARCNGRDFPERHFSKKSNELKSEESEGGKRESKAGIGDLFRNRVIAARTLNMFFQWASTR